MQTLVGEREGSAVTLPRKALGDAQGREGGALGEGGALVAQHLLCARGCARCFPGLLSLKSYNQLLR